MDKKLEELIEGINKKLEGKLQSGLNAGEQILFSVHEEKGNNYIKVYGDFEKNMKYVPEIRDLLEYINNKGYKIIYD